MNGGGTLPVTYTLLLLTVLICGTLGSDTLALIKAMVVRHVEVQDDVSTGRARATEEDRGVAKMRRHLFLVLQQALS